MSRWKSWRSIDVERTSPAADTDEYFLNSFKNVYSAVSHSPVAGFSEKQQRTPPKVSHYVLRDKQLQTLRASPRHQCVHDRKPRGATRVEHCQQLIDLVRVNARKNHLERVFEVDLCALLGGVTTRDNVAFRVCSLCLT